MFGENEIRRSNYSKSFVYIFYPVLRLFTTFHTYLFCLILGLFLCFNNDKIITSLKVDQHLVIAIPLQALLHQS